MMLVTEVESYNGDVLPQAVVEKEAKAPTMVSIPPRLEEEPPPPPVEEEEKR